MLNKSSLAVAIVQRQVMLVQATREHAHSERWLDVYIYHPLGNRVFFAPHSLTCISPSDSFESLEKSNPPTARIASKDLLTIFPESDAHRADAARAAERGMLELPLQAYLEYVELATRNQKRMESMWGQWQAKSRMRLRFGARAARVH